MPQHDHSSTPPPLVWITGAGGLIGSELVRAAQTFAPRWKPRGLLRADADLLDHSAVTALFRREQPAALIHCAAVSRSPICEKDPAFAWRTNVEATRLLLDLAADIPFLFFSSDLVFDGRKGNYSEDDPTSPLSVYAETKVAAEESVRLHPRHAILRISLTGGRSPGGGSAFNEEIEKAWRQGRTLHLFTDEFRCPLPVQPVARAVWELLDQNACGTFHLNGAERLSRYEIGQLLADRHPELNPLLVPCSRKEYQGPPRPADTSLNCNKIQRILSFPIPGLKTWLEANPQAGF